MAAKNSLPLSADGLRQLARNLKQGDSDPLAYDWTVDRDLGRLFGIEEIPPQAEPAPARERLKVAGLRADLRARST